jgi:ribosomal-protein-alanine N-acetyltransferase
MSAHPLPRPAQLSDAPHLHKIIIQEMHSPWSLKQIEAEIINGVCWVLGFEPSRASSSPGAFLFGRSVGVEFEITYIGVDKLLKRQGYGKTLLAHALSEISPKVVFLEVSEKNTSAQSFYKAQGFVESGVRKQYYPDGSNAILMKLDLAKP